MELNSSESNNKVAIGRFRLTVPDTLQALSRTQIIYGVEVEAIQAVDGAWQAKLAALGTPVLSRPNLGEGVEAVWYKKANDLLLEAQLVRDGAAVSILRDAPEGKEAVAEKLSAAVLENYKSGVAAGFCLGPGAIHMGPSLTESVRINWEQPLSGVKLDFSTRTVTEPDTKTFMDVDEERGFARLSGGSLTVLLERDRTAAGLAGREIRIVLALPGQEPQVRFTWHYPGVGRDGTKPKIDFVAKGPLAAQPQMESLWDAILPSLESIPVK